MCTGRSLVCAVLAGQKLLLFTYVFLPTAALLALLLMHVVAELLSKSLAGVEENKALRKAVQTQAKQYQEQLQTGILDHSLWLGRTRLALQLSLFLLDIASDVVCFIEFLQMRLWGFAACQGVIFIVSGILQLKSIGYHKFARIILESWNIGLPCNDLQRILVEEKTFEAPLSLFVQYLAAFWLAGDAEAFFKLWVSIFLSTVAISTGLFLRNHVAIIDFEDLNDDIGASATCPSKHQPHGQAINAGNPWPRNGPLPPPPGLRFPERYFQPIAVGAHRAHPYDTE